MPNSFSWMTFWPAIGAIGSIVIAILAIWGDLIRSKLAPAKLSIAEHNLRGDVTNFNNGVQAIFYHLKVQNLKPWVTAKNCRVTLVAIAKRCPNNQFLPISFSVPAPFHWAPAEFSPLLETITGERIFDFGFLLQNQFQPSIIPVPNNFPGFVKANEAIRYSLQITADNFVSPIHVVEVAWNGQWSSNLDDMAKNLTIRKIEE